MGRPPFLYVMNVKVESNPSAPETRRATPPTDIASRPCTFLFPFCPSRSAEVAEKKAKMERHLHLGFNFKLTDPEILVYLYCRVNSLPSPGEFVLEGNLKDFQIDQPPDFSRYGCFGRIYLYIDCLYKNKPGRPRDRTTIDGKGSWKSDGQVCVRDEKGEAVGYKQNFRFYQQEPGRKVSTTWVMTEYTIHSNKSDKNTKAICVLRNTKED